MWFTDYDFQFSSSEGSTVKRYLKFDGRWKEWKLKPEENLRKTVMLQQLSICWQLNKFY